jgi:hypothetical protein
MKRILALALLFGVFAGFVGCDSGTTSTPATDKPATGTGTQTPTETK